MRKVKLNEKKVKRIKAVLHKLDWIKILHTAIESRPTSWGIRPVREWRNASDEILFAVVKEIEKLKSSG